MVNLNSIRQTTVVGTVPHNPTYLQRMIQKTQRALKYPEPYASISHVLLRSIDGAGIQMVWPWGNIIYDVEKEYSNCDLYYSILKEGQPRHLFAAGIKEMYHSFYAGGQVGAAFFYWFFEIDFYTKLPNFIQKNIKFCSEGVFRSYQRCKALSDVKTNPNFILPAWFFIDPHFLILS